MDHHAGLYLCYLSDTKTRQAFVGEYPRQAKTNGYDWLKTIPRACGKANVLEIRDQESCISRKLIKKQEKQDQAEPRRAQLQLGEVVSLLSSN